ncbi:hypothetical protein TNCV_2855431 [Trichonephila clavipes]|nr:hypothetical protein TNCV_2855431 [Trichonephila clavipes]
MPQAPVDSPSEEGWSRRQKQLRWAARVGRDRRIGSFPSLYRPLESMEWKRKLDLTGASEMNRLYPNSRRESIKEDKYLNTLPRRGGGWRKKRPNENETKFDEEVLHSFNCVLEIDTLGESAAESSAKRHVLIVWCSGKSYVNMLGEDGGRSGLMKTKQKYVTRARMEERKEGEGLNSPKNAFEEHQKRSRDEEMLREFFFFCSRDEKMDGDCKAKLTAGTVGFEAGVSLFLDPNSDVGKCI